MFFLSSIRREPAFREGVVNMAPVAMGIGAWGLMTGVAMVKSGMRVIESVAMTLLVAGAPFWVVLATGFCVNLRFVVFSLHLRPYLMHMPRWRRMTHGYLTADMSYAMFTSQYPEPASTDEQRRAQEAYLTGGYCVTWFSWMGMSLIGIALGNLIPQGWGLGFAGVLSLVGILCSMATSRLRVLAGLIAGATAVAAFALPLKLNIVVAIGVAVLLCFWIEKGFVPNPATEDDA